jgi:hypothetical protein
MSSGRASLLPTRGGSGRVGKQENPGGRGPIHGTVAGELWLVGASEKERCLLLVGRSQRGSPTNHHMHSTASLGSAMGGHRAELVALVVVVPD